MNMAADADEVPTDDGELDTIMRALSTGVTMTKFRKNKNKPEQKTFQLNLEEVKISWFRPGTGREEGNIHIEDIKEIRCGVLSNDFSYFLKRIENSNCCLVIVYGNKFVLKTLSCMAQSVVLRDYWVKGLNNLLSINQMMKPLVQTHRWLSREWSALPKNNQQRISMREYKMFLQNANIKLSNNKVKDLFQSVSQSVSRGIDGEGFRRTYDNLLHNSFIAERFQPYFNNIEEGKMSVKAFQSFLYNEQEDNKANNPDYAKNLMLNCIQDLSTFRGFLDVKQFVDFLFSPLNSIFNEDNEKIYQDMTKPLNYYWIASSHNTYLTGDQFLSESSVEAYTRCLLMGCRCIELDCWDGDHDEPLIYHGKTFTSRITLLEVVKAIAENAFKASEYPLILSIENHCSIPQQIIMANHFKKYFKSDLITQYADSNETQLPSPEALKHKIIIKNKKNNRGADDAIMSNVSNNRDSMMDDNLLANAIKVGLVYMEDEEKKWNKHLFVMTQRYIFYSHEQEGNEEEDDEDECDEQSLLNKEDIYYSEKWFHRISRQEAERLLQKNHRGDGSFLVRPSKMYAGDFSLSFWRGNRVQHCHIKYQQGPDGAPKYIIVFPKSFDNLYNLINYYQLNPLKADTFEMKLTEPVPQPHAHLGKDWYHENLTRQQAEDMLKRMRKDGYFLVRRKAIGIDDGDAESYAISFRTGGSVKHCVIKKEERLYTIGSAPFESLVELVAYYGKHPLYKKTKLQYACNEKVVKEYGEHHEEDEENNCDPIYTPPNLTAPRPACIAMYDYKGQQDDELTFCKGAMIVNIVKYDGGWWRGDYNGQVQKWFPFNFTKETVLRAQPEPEPEPEPVEEKDPLASMQKGVINLTGCQPQIQPSTDQRHYIFSLNTSNGTYNCSVDEESETVEWLNAIQEATSEASNAASRPAAKLNQKKELAMELSDLIVYCVSVQFNEDCFDCGEYYEMSSFSELKAERYVSKRTCDLRFLKLHQRQLSRVYPKAKRIDSSNYDPVPFWNSGFQMCALNYQTDDRSMQIERGLFLDNGRCGYVLQPEFMRDPDFNPFEVNTLKGVEPLNIHLTVLAARHLQRTGRGLTSPFVEVEIAGLSYDQQSFTTKPKNENGLCPTWNKTFIFDVICPPLAKIRFCVNDEDMFGEPKFIAQACFPLTSLRPGFRSVPLKNSFSEEIPLASLLVEIKMQNAKDDEEYASIAELRDKMQLLRDKQDTIRQWEESETQMQLMHFEDELSRLNNERETRHKQMEAGKTKNLPR